MPEVFETDDTTFFVGGRGTKAGDADAGGGATKAAWEGALGEDLANVMDANGGTLSNDGLAWSGAQVSCSITESGGGDVLITKNAAFTDVSAGIIAYIEFLIPGYPDGRYKITAANANAIEIDLTYIEDTLCDVKAGGAFDTLQVALDNTDANGTSPHNVDILTNKDETFTGAGDQIDIDASGGDMEDNTWQRVIGIDNEGVELDAYSYVTLDGNGQACDVIHFGLVDNIELRHIYAKDTDGAHYGYTVTMGAVHYNFTFKDCKSTGCRRAMEFASSNMRNIAVIGGYYECATSTTLYFQYTYGVSIQDCIVKVNSNFACITAYVSGTIWVRDSLLISDGSGWGCKFGKVNSVGVVTNCVFYNTYDGIMLDEVEQALIEYNNIYLLSGAAAGLFINRIQGSILYSDYSCGWALDGVPAAADRWGGDGLPANSFEEDPLFVDAANDDFRLEINSPCLKTGRKTLGKL